ncbi:lysophospholipid acyltransferase family protein [Jannaschia sp. CCS1]|uniref:lysophospholipid acyltransferase family protein n=1 Tax=Jannaschia sp. (strain CCS1) TaxID=290400 RepID=UPI000053D008|nr:lysophospholipid acyltransferase family protein [Jannaschia sp. CCS1]ABD57133.1 lipid A biosynthesis acyltransferase [Jannaschia sp. CCS1]
MKEYIEYIGISAVLTVLAVLPHRVRVRLAGVAGKWILAPLLGWRERIRDNLTLAMPDLGAAERQDLTRRVCDHLGRLFIELFSPKAMARVAAETPFGGPGAEALTQALADGRPVICVSGHFGSYDVGRAALVQRGFNVGGLYRPMNNARFNTRYERAIGAVGGQIFPRDRKGFSTMIKHLRDGGLLTLLIDQHMDRGERLSFFDQPAYTSVQAAQMALKYGAILVPIYAIRQADGLSFTIEVEPPIPATDEVTMTQAINDSLEARVRAHPEQWLWTHRRWKAAR